MDSKLAKLAKYKQIMGIAVAAIILTVIFVPLQTADAYTLTTTLPNTTGNTSTQSASGENFQVDINVAAGELISISTIEIIADNGQGTVKRTVFSSAGQRVLGNTDLVKDNVVTISVPTSTTSGYAYGFGTVSGGTTFSAPYSYAFTYSNAFIAGNNAGYSNAVGNGVNGYVGPVTLTISGKLLTGLMATGSHTLDVLVNTGAGVSPDRLVAPQLGFTVNSNVQVTTQTINTGTNVQTTISSSAGDVTITFSNVSSGGQIVIEEKSASTLDTETPTIFNTVGTTTSTFTVGTASGTTAGAILEIDLSALSVGGTIDVTIPYDPTLIPSGTQEGDVRFFHWTGTAWEDVTIAVDTTANTVTGRLTSLSPVVSGVYGTTTTTTTTTPGGAAGGTGVIINQTFPPEYFEIRPLQKLQLQDSKFTNIAGQTVFGGKVGQQISIDATFRNYQQNGQAYAIIIQVVDKDGFTTDLSWITGVADVGGNASTSRSLTLGAIGDYTVRIFVWNGVSQAPTPLSEVTNKTFTVTS